MNEVCAAAFVSGLKIGCFVAGAIVPPLIRFGIVALLFDW